MAKSKYSEDLLPLVEGYARRGLKDKEIFESLGISKNAFYTYIRVHDDFKDCLKKGRRDSVIEMENALFEKGIGGHFGAQVFYLVNRAPDRWQSIQREQARDTGDIREQLAKVAEAIAQSDG